MSLRPPRTGMGITWRVPFGLQREGVHGERTRLVGGNEDLRAAGCSRCARDHGLGSEARYGPAFVRQVPEHVGIHDRRGVEVRFLESLGTSGSIRSAEVAPYREAFRHRSEARSARAQNCVERCENRLALASGAAQEEVGRDRLAVRLREHMLEKAVFVARSRPRPVERIGHWGAVREKVHVVVDGVEDRVLGERGVGLEPRAFGPSAHRQLAGVAKLVRDRDLRGAARRAFGILVRREALEAAMQHQRRDIADAVGVAVRGHLAESDLHASAFHHGARETHRIDVVCPGDFRPSTDRLHEIGHAVRRRDVVQWDCVRPRRFIDEIEVLGGSSLLGRRAIRRQVILQLIDDRRRKLAAARFELLDERGDALDRETGSAPRRRELSWGEDTLKANHEVVRVRRRERPGRRECAQHAHTEDEPRQMERNADRTVHWGIPPRRPFYSRPAPPASATRPGPGPARSGPWPRGPPGSPPGPDPRS